MQILGLILIFINVLAIAAPIVGVAIIHSDNLSELVIPVEIEEIISNSINNDVSLKLPQYVSSSYDMSSQTAQATFNFTNPFDVTLIIYSFSADLVCNTHNFSLGHAFLSEQIQLDKEETENITIFFIWTENSENHFLNNHYSSTSIEIRLVDIQVEISGISIEIPEQVTIDIPLNL
jgi:hypothetical protein